MAQPRVLILTGYGINCDDETAYAFQYAGADAEIVHINRLIDNRKQLNDFQVFVFPGGFSYGDDTGSGKALANRIKNNLLDELQKFVSRDTLMLGICNGFQVMTMIGVIPATEGFTGEATVALEHNSTFRYQCRWVDLKVEKTDSVFTQGIDRLHIPVAHGEGNFFAPPEKLAELEESGLITMRYVKPDGSPAQGEFPENPNGSLNDIASICDKTGRLMGMMPHPERGMFFSQRDDWTRIRDARQRNGEDIPVESDGLAIFSNAVNYFS